jgi:hypothetical protein
VTLAAARRPLPFDRSGSASHDAIQAMAPRHSTDERSAVEAVEPFVERVRSLGVALRDHQYVFGKAPNYLLPACKPLLPRVGKAPAVADGEARNGVWLAEQDLDVLSRDLLRHSDVRTGATTSTDSSTPQ